MSGEAVVEEEVIINDPTKDTIDYWTSLLEDTSKQAGKIEFDSFYELKLFEQISNKTQNKKQNKRDIKKKIKSIIENCPFPTDKKKMIVERYTESQEYMNVCIDKMDPKNLFIFDVESENWTSALELEKKGTLLNIEESEFDWDIFKQYRDMNTLNDYQKELDEWIHSNEKSKTNKALSVECNDDKKIKEKENLGSDKKNDKSKESNREKIQEIMENKEVDNYQLKKRKKNYYSSNLDSIQKKSSSYKHDKNIDNMAAEQILLHQSLQSTNTKEDEEVLLIDKEIQTRENIDPNVSERSKCNVDFSGRTEYKSSYEDDYIVTFSFFSQQKTPPPTNHSTLKNVSPSFRENFPFPNRYNDSLQQEKRKKEFLEQKGIYASPLKQIPEIQTEETLRMKSNFQNEFSKDLKSILSKRALSAKNSNNYETIVKKVRFADQVHEIKQIQSVNEPKIVTISDDEERFESEQKNELKLIEKNSKEDNFGDFLKQNKLKEELNNFVQKRKRTFQEESPNDSKVQMATDVFPTISNLATFLSTNSLKMEEFQSQSIHPIKNDRILRPTSQLNYQQNQSFPLLFPPQFPQNQPPKPLQMKQAYPPWFEQPQYEHVSLMNNSHFSHQRLHEPYLNNLHQPYPNHSRYYEASHYAPYHQHFRTQNNTNNVFIEKINLKANPRDIQCPPYNNFNKNLPRTFQSSKVHLQSSNFYTKVEVEQKNIKSLKTELSFKPKVHEEREPGEIFSEEEVEVITI